MRMSCVDGVAADGVRDQEPASGTQHLWAPNHHGMAPGRARAEPGPSAQRLRCQRRKRLGGPSHDRPLRHPPRSERDRVAERDDHRTDATDPNPHLGRASELTYDHARDLG